jgi:hypothetical protein
MHETFPALSLLVYGAYCFLALTDALSIALATSVREPQLLRSDRGVALGSPSQLDFLA